MAKDDQSIECDCCSKVISLKGYTDEEIAILKQSGGVCSEGCCVLLSETKYNTSFICSGEKFINKPADSTPFAIGIWKVGLHYNHRSISQGDNIVGCSYDIVVILPHGKHQANSLYVDLQASLAERDGVILVLGGKDSRIFSPFPAKRAKGDSYISTSLKNVKRLTGHERILVPDDITTEEMGKIREMKREHGVAVTIDKIPVEKFKLLHELEGKQIKINLVMPEMDPKNTLPENELILCPICKCKMENTDYWRGIMMFKCKECDIYKDGSVE